MKTLISVLVCAASLLAIRTSAGNLTIDGTLTANSNLTVLSTITLGDEARSNWPFNGYKCVVVPEGSNDVHRGNNLRAAYSTAAILSPSSTNRATVILPPGNYNLNGTDLSLASNYVDLVGLVPCQMTARKTFTDSTGMEHTKTVANVQCPVRIFGAAVSQSAGDVHIESVIISNYAPSVASTNTLLRHVATTLMSSDISYLGEYVDCTGGDRSFGYDSGDNGIVAGGTFIDCVAGSSSFGSRNADGATASGTFIDCTAGNASFGGENSGEASGVFIRCVGGDYCFAGDGGTASGTFIDCTAGTYSFGSDNVLASTARLQHCAAGTGSFGWLEAAHDDFNYDPAGRTVFGSDVDIDGKLNLYGGMDPPYVLLDSATRDSVANRVAREVPPSKQTGAALYWNSETQQLEVYVATRGTYYNLGGNVLATITPPVANDVTVTTSYGIDRTLGTVVSRDTVKAPHWQVKPGYRFNSSTGTFSRSDSSGVLQEVIAQEALELK